MRLRLWGLATTLTAESQQHVASGPTPQKD